MTTKASKVLIGCALTSVGVVLVLGLSCVGFNRWLHSPGELLEPTQLLDSHASGYLEWRLELENPATAQLVEALLELVAEQQAAELEGQPAFIRLLASWNQGRQQESLERLFPSTAAWTLYPGDSPGEDDHLLSVSIKRAGHQIVFADWLLELLAPRFSDMPTVDIDGETVLVLEFPEPTTPRSAYVFLHPKGVFVGSNLAAAEHAVERLRLPTESISASTSALDSLYGLLPTDLQLRGAIINQHAELERIASFLFPERPALASSLGDVDSMTIGGGVDRSGDAIIDLAFTGGAESLEVELTYLAQMVTDYLAQDGVEQSSRVVRTTRGWTLELRIEDLPASAHRVWSRIEEDVERMADPPAEDPRQRRSESQDKVEREEGSSETDS